MAVVDGVINFNKPVGITSAKALYRVRRIVGELKSGHAGTLDPAASGVLVLCLGRATKLVERIMDQPKVYRAKARLDATSISLDSDSPLQSVSVVSIPSQEEVEGALGRFVGVIEQVPPLVSAIKVGGVPSYKLVGTGSEVALSPRRTRIYWLHVHEYTWPEIDFEMACGRGCYVRALIRDLGVALGTGGCLTGLHRRRVGPFDDGTAWSFEGLSQAGADQYLIALPRTLELLSAGADNAPTYVPSLDPESVPRA